MADDVRHQAAELVRRTTRAQGLPEQITDPAALRRIATVIATGEEVVADAVA